MPVKKTVFRLSGVERPDVFISTPLQKFSLHSRVLRANSSWFSASMSELWWTKGNEKEEEEAATQSGDTTHYPYVLDFDKDGISTLLPRRKSLSVGEAPEAEQVEVLCEAFHAMFTCFYGLPIRYRSFDKYTALISLANQYGALDSVAESIRASLFEWPELDEEIKKNPTPFLMLGYELQSARVFKEAFVHTVGLFVGQHNKLSVWSKDDAVPALVVQLVMSECCRLDQLVASAVKSYLALDAESFLGDSVRNHYSTHAGQIALGILKSQIGRYFALYSVPGSDGILFRSIAEGTFGVAAGQFGGCGSPAQIQSFVEMTASVIRRIRDTALGFLGNNLRLRGETSHLVCAELSGEDLPTWLAIS